MKYRSLKEATAIPILDISQAQAGDAIMCHSKGLVGQSIRFGQSLHYPKEYSVWNHICWLDHRNDAGEWIVGQAVAHGVQIGALLTTIAPGGNYEIVSMDAFPTRTGEPIRRDIALAALRAQEGRYYGWPTIASVSVTLLSPIQSINVMLPNTWICSAVYGFGLVAGGVKLDPPDVYQVLPAEIAELSDPSLRVTSGTVKGIVH